MDNRDYAKSVERVVCSCFRKFRAGNFKIEDEERCNHGVFFNHGYDYFNTSTNREFKKIT